MLMLIEQMVSAVAATALLSLLALVVELAIEEFCPRLALIPITIKRR